MNKKLVSIIIPVYNNEDLLPKCLDSVVNQSYKNIEVLLIDDGSKDKSGSICDEYQQRDSRVRVFHRENQGASLARKFGLSEAKGEFVQFVDSDDWIKLDMTEKLMDSVDANNSDIAWCDVEMVEKGGNYDFNIKFDSSSSEMLKSLYWGKISGWLVNKVIRTSLFSDIVFPMNSMMEDVFISTQLLLKSAKNSYVPEAFYCYNRLNENAATSKNSGNEFLIKSTSNIENCYDYLVKNNVFPLYETAFSCLAMRLKIAMSKMMGIEKAKSIFPFAQKHIESYGIKPPVAYIYWIGFNGGKLGAFLLSKYQSIKG